METQDQPNTIRPSGLILPSSPGGIARFENSPSAKPIPQPVYAWPERAICRFCQIRSSTAVWDKVILESEHFIVVPSKGAFLPGWLMVVPISHVLSMAQLPLSLAEELDSLLVRVTCLLELHYSAPTMFEHGAVTAGTTFGCGIDHAHLHVVPLPAGVDLRMMAEAALDEPFVPRETALTRPYLRIREPRSRAWLAVEPSTAPPRQFFRQTVWRGTGARCLSYDYDESPCEEQVRKTVATLVDP
jgi:ATP adenylyltransferase